MAYKNQKKNKKKVRGLHITQGYGGFKWYRKKTRYERTHPKETEREAMLRIGKQLGII